MTTTIRSFVAAFACFIMSSAFAAGNKEPLPSAEVQYEQLKKARWDAFTALKKNDELEARLAQANQKIEELTLRLGRLSDRLGDAEDKIAAIGGPSRAPWHGFFASVNFGDYPLPPLGFLEAHLYLEYRPPIWGGRLGFGLKTGYGWVMTKDQFNVSMKYNGNLDLKTTFVPWGGLVIPFRIVNYDNFSIAVGPSYDYIGKFEKNDPKAAHLVGATAHIMFGSLRIEFQKLFNLSKIDNYMSAPAPAGRDLWHVALGWEFYPKW